MNLIVFSSEILRWDGPLPGFVDMIVTIATNDGQAARKTSPNPKAHVRSEPFANGMGLGNRSIPSIGMMKRDFWWDGLWRPNPQINAWRGKKPAEAKVRSKGSLAGRMESG